MIDTYGRDEGRSLGKAPPGWGPGVYVDIQKGARARTAGVGMESDW